MRKTNTVLKRFDFFEKKIKVLKDVKDLKVGQNHPDPFRGKNHRHEKTEKIDIVRPRSIASSGWTFFFLPFSVR